MDDNKKPGNRDISDLKARLGLKKAGGAAPAPGGPPTGTPDQSGGSVPPPTGAVPPPTGASGQGAIPSPFGTPAPQPAAPQAPADPRRDPYGAQQAQQAANLAAFYGYNSALPGDAGSVADTPIEKPRPWGSIGAAAVAALLVFGIGYAAGRIFASRGNYNMTIDSAAQIRDEVDKMSKSLQTVIDTLNASRATARGDVDMEMTEKLGAAVAGLKKPDTQRIFHSNYFFMEDIAIERLFTYYNDTIQLYDDCTKHAKKTDADKDAINNFVKNGAGKGDKNYGVTIDLSGAIPLAHFVEVGSPVCVKEGQVDCNANELKGFKYRADSGAPWAERPVKGKPGETVVPIQATPFFKSVAAGNPDILAVRDYARRVANIRATAQKLLAAQKDVLADLKRSADRPKLFTF